jgi:hypothetical protein
VDQLSDNIDISACQKIIYDLVQYFIDNPDEYPIIIKEVESDMLSFGTTIRRYRLREEKENGI